MKTYVYFNNITMNSFQNDCSRQLDVFLTVHHELTIY